MTYTLTTLRRTLLRQRGFTAINVLGLAVGLAACVLILLYARNELTWDRYHEHAGRTHLILKERHLPSGDQVLWDTWIPLADALTARQPEIQAAVRVVEREEPVFLGEQGFTRSVIATDPSFFDVFSFRVVNGDGAELLADHDQALLTAEAAHDMFGPGDPLGKTFRYDDRSYLVGGLLEPYPDNVSHQPDIVVNFRSVVDYEDAERDDLWGSSFLETWIRLPAEVTPAGFEPMLEAFEEAQFGATGGPNAAANMDLRLLPLAEVHEHFTGTRTIAVSLLVIAAVILVIAVVNFTNLSIAASFRRAREIGMRKVLGAGRSRLLRQFLVESVLIVALAMVIAVGLIEITRPWMNAYFNIELQFPLASDWRVAAWLLTFTVAVGLLAGAYPAMVLASFRPMRTLKGVAQKGRGGVLVRHALLGLQFALAVALLSLTAVVWQQIQYMKDHSLNLDTGGVVAIEYDLGRGEEREAAGSRLDAAMAELAMLPGVTEVSNSSGVPGAYPNMNVFARPAEYDGDVPFRVQIAGAGPGFFELFGMEMLAGSPFDEADVAAEERDEPGGQVAILNETAARMMGLLEDPSSRIGTTLQAAGRRELVGIVADHHVAPLTDEIRPLVYVPTSPTFGASRYVSLRLAPGPAAPVLAEVEAVWAGFDRSGAFEFFFVDEQLRARYQSQERIITLAGLFALIGVLIASVGLLGLISYAVVLRTREIGVRKVLGASAGQIVAVLGREYLLPVLLANAFAWPLAWWMSTLYLREFPYRMDMPWLIFLAASLLALLLAASTVATAAWRAANIKPSETLRYE